jgi:transposase
MPAPYSDDLRQKIIQAVEKEDLTKPQIAQLFNVSNNFIYTLCKLHRTTGSLSPKKMGGHVKPKINPAGESSIHAWLAKEPSLSLPELCDKYQNDFNLSVGTSSMSRALKRMGISRKKRVLTTLKNTKIEFNS